MMNWKDTFAVAINIIRKQGVRAFVKAVVSFVRGTYHDVVIPDPQQPVSPLVLDDLLGNYNEVTVADTGVGVSVIIPNLDRAKDLVKLPPTLYGQKSTSMNVLYVVHQFFPVSYLGTEKFLLNLSTCMQKCEHKVKVVSYSSYKNSFYDEVDNGFLQKEYIYKGIPVLAYKQQTESPNFHWDIENPSLIQFAERILKKERPDLLHIAHGMRVAAFALAAQRLGIPYIITLTDFFLLCPNSKLVTSKGTLCAGPEEGEKCQTFCPEFNNTVVRNRWKLSEQILRGARTVVAPSKALGNLFKREYRWLTPNVIPYGIDFRAIKRNTRQYDGKEKLTLLFAGQIDIHKGVHVLIDAVKRMESQNILVKIYGSGPPMVERKLKQMANGDPRIQFCGVYAEHQLGDVFSSVDCVVIPSVWHENNTIVMREALASQVPCIVSDAGGMVEMIREGKNGFVFRMGDSNHLKEILEKLVADPKLLAATKKDLNAYAVTTVEQEAYAYEKTYMEAIRKKIEP